MEKQRINISLCVCVIVTEEGISNGKYRAFNVNSSMVGVERFELPTLWSQTRCATRLRYTPPRRWVRYSQ
jgi:hypothetical protein